MHVQKRVRSGLSFGAICVLFLGACSVDSARNHYVLAEKLWADRKYSAAVSEFEKVTSKDGRGKLGQQALYRAAMTQFLFLSQYGEAIRNFRSYIQLSADSQMIWDAQIQIGEILFTKTEQYDQAIMHYRALLKQKAEAVEAPEFMFRVAKSHFFMFQFEQAVQAYKELIRKFPHSIWTEKANYEIGSTYFTLGEQRPISGDHTEAEAYETAMAAFETFIKKYPKSERIPEAKFGIASCLVELDRLDEAYEVYGSLKDTYPSPTVVAVKLARIRERLSHRGKSR